MFWFLHCGVSCRGHGKLVVGRPLWHHDQAEPCSDNDTEQCSVWQPDQRRGSGRVADIDGRAGQASPGKRADARRNEQTLLAAAAAIFVTSGVEAPVRDIAAKAGVGMGTIYRHFPTRADLIIAVYRHQVEACAEAGPALLASSVTPHAALKKLINLFVDFLVTKHGLAAALRSDQARFQTLHAYFLDRLVPVCAELLHAATAVGGIRPGTDAFGLLYAVGNL